MRTDSEEAIRRSIIHSLLGDLDEQESRTLENWLKTPEHQDFYKKISNREYVRCKMAGLELSDKEKARERLKMNIARRIERYRRRKVGEGSRDCSAVVYGGRRLVLLAK